MTRLSPSSQAALRLVNIETGQSWTSVDPFRMEREPYDSAAWCGRRPERIERLRRRAHWAIRDLLWPGYPCEQCVGQAPGEGCYCAYYGAIAPGGPGPGRLRAFGRRFYNWWLGSGRF